MFIRENDICNFYMFIFDTDTNFIKLVKITIRAKRTVNEENQLIIREQINVARKKLRY